MIANFLYHPLLGRPPWAIYTILLMFMCDQTEVPDRGMRFFRAAANRYIKRDQNLDDEVEPEAEAKTLASKPACMALGPYLPSLAARLFLR